MFKSKTDVLNAILIVFLSALAVFQVQWLLMQPGVPGPEPAALVQYTVDRAPEVRPEAPPPRTPGRSGIRVARVHMADATN